MNDVDYKDEALLMIGPPGLIKLAMENRGYSNVRVWERSATVYMVFDCRPGHNGYAHTIWLIENFAKSVRLSMLGHVLVHAETGSRMTARFSYDDSRK